MQTRPSDLYRMPWSLTDNVLAWLEPTKRCNLACEGCYSRNDLNSDKTLDRVRDDLDVMVASRNLDSISIAGGDPLVYPHIVETVRLIRHSYGLKPIVNTNGLGLTDDLLLQLRDAGLYGFTFHVDSGQGRPGWKKTNEIALNALRLELAERVHRVGDLSVAFNATVYPHTLNQVPALVRWAGEHIDLVHGMVFILFRTSRSGEFEYLANGAPVQAESLVYNDMEKNPAPLVAEDAMAAIRDGEPLYRPAAYLGGTQDPHSLKWTLATRIGRPDKTYGFVGPRFMELVQSAWHTTTGHYVAYTKPSLLRHGRSLLALAPLDAGISAAARAWAKDVVLHPLRARKRLHLQSILVIQPIDMMADGSMNMCDGCPDMTVHDGQLVWSCRLDEKLQHGCFLSARPRTAA